MIEFSVDLTVIISAILDSPAISSILFGVAANFIFKYLEKLLKKKKRKK